MAKTLLWAAVRAEAEPLGALQNNLPSNPAPSSLPEFFPTGLSHLSWY